MIGLTNPFCPVSFGLMGFLSSVVSRRSISLLPFGGREKDEPIDEDEEVDLLVHDDRECDELSEDRITNFLESQKVEYYKSIGMVPPKQQSSFDTSTTPGASMIEFSSSRETSYIDESEDSTLLFSRADEQAQIHDQATNFEPQTYVMNEDSDTDEPILNPDESVPDLMNEGVRDRDDSSARQSVAATEDGFHQDVDRNVSIEDEC